MNVFELIFAILIVWLAAWLSTKLANALDIHLFLASGMTVVGGIVLAQLIGIFIRGRKPNSDDSESPED